MRIIIIICHWFQPLEDYQPGLERGRWAEPAVQKWVSCFHHSRPFPTTSTTSTTACWHGELHLTRRAPSHTESSVSHGELHLTRRAPSHTESSVSHGELHLTRRAPSHHDGLLTRRAPSHHDGLLTPHCTTASPLPPLAYIDILCVELPAARYAQKNNNTRPFRALRPFRAHPVCVWNGGLTESTAGVYYLHRVLIKKKKYKNKQTNKNKKSSVASAASSVTLRGLPKADHCGQRSQYRTRNSEAGCSIPSLASDCG